MSCGGIECLTTHENTPFVYAGPVTASSMGGLLTRIEEAVNQAQKVTTQLYQLCRRKSSEVLVWLIQDTDREWNPEYPHSMPIAYALKGYTLTVEVMCRMCAEILKSCSEQQIRVLGLSFDGQWINLITKDRRGKPLTLLQLQRDVWQKAQKTKKSDIIRILKSIGIGCPQSKMKLYFDICHSVNWQRVFKMIKQKKTKPPEEHQAIQLQQVDDLALLPNDVLNVMSNEQDVPERGVRVDDLVPPAEDDESDITDSPGIETETEQISVKHHSMIGDNVNSSDDDGGDFDNFDGVGDLFFNTSGEATGLDDRPTTRCADLSDDLLDTMIGKLSLIKPRWHGSKANELRVFIQENTAENLLSMTKVELLEIAECILGIQVLTNTLVYKSWDKSRIVNALSNMIGDGSNCQTSHRKICVQNPQSLVIQSTKALVRCPKMVLNALYASFAL